MSASASRRSGAHHGVAAGLHWVRGELDQNLQLASQLVEQHSESRQDPAALHKAQSHLHELRGAAVVIQAYGLALLAEEMKQTVQDLAAGSVHEPDPAYAAVVSACLQAGDYLDLLQQGQDDSVLVLQPIVNELRLARGKSLLTEDDLFVAQFRVLGLELEPNRTVRAEGNAQIEAARLLPTFSAALLGWFKDQDSAQCLSRIGRVAEMLAEVSRERALHQLWRTAAACIEAILSKTLDETLELKRQFGRAGQLMKILAEAGEASAARQMSDVSLRLLFYAGRSRGSGPRVTALRSGLELDTWLPPVEVVQGRRARLRGANTGLLVRVAEELRTDLAEVRDDIDMALRSGATQAEFENTRLRLKRVADTLLVLGLSTESQALAQPLETLREAGAPEPAAPAAWMEFATAVLQVDLSLESALYRQLRPQPGQDNTAAGVSAGVDVRDGTAALLRESLVNIARIKGYVEAYVKADDVLGLPEAARLIDEIAAGFRILDRGRAEDLVLEVQRFLQSPDFALVRSSNTVAGRFADAIAAIEYYIEFLRDGMPGAAAALDHLEGLVARMKVRVEPGADARPTAQPVPAAEQASAQAAAPVEDPYALTVPEDHSPAAAPSEFASTGDEPVAEKAGIDLPIEPFPEPQQAPAPLATEPAEIASAPSEAVELPPAAPVASEVQAAEPEVDPEIREIFIAEAGEVLEHMQRALPRWLRQPEDRELLVSIRRNFHTLKGSGRMVDARDISEFSFAVETLLNRTLDRTIELSAALIDTVRDAVGLLPEMIAAFRENRAAPARALPLAEQARQLASGIQAAGEAAELISVFRGDAADRLKMVSLWLADQHRSIGEYDVPEPIVRAFHTLHGAALAIGARAVGELSGSLEAYLDTLHRAHLPLPDSGLSLLEDSCAVLRDWIAHLDQPGAMLVDPRPWIERVEAVRAGVDQESGEQDEDRELAEVFAFEALDLVQKFESDLLGWSQSPYAPGFARSLKTTVHTLKGAAGMAHCPPIAALSQALNLRFGAMTDASVPSPAFFESMRGIVEGLYTLLDAYRDGTLTGDGSEWVARVMAIEDPAVGDHAAPRVSAPASEPVVAAETPLASVESVQVPDEIASDRELIEIFLLEGQDLIEEIERHASQIAARPDDSYALGAWQRALHTLKGSANVTGLYDIGELAHRLETATEEAAAGGPAAHGRFAARLRVAVDGLHELLDEARSGRSGAMQGILARFEAADAPAEEPVDPAQADQNLEAPVVEPGFESVPENSFAAAAEDLLQAEPPPPEPDTAYAEPPSEPVQEERYEPAPELVEPPAGQPDTESFAEPVVESFPEPVVESIPEPVPDWVPEPVPDSIPAIETPPEFAQAPTGPVAETDAAFEAEDRFAEPMFAPPEPVFVETPAVETPAVESAAVESPVPEPVEPVEPVEPALSGSAPPPTEVAAKRDEVDADLLAIFAPEAVELLDSLQKALEAWRELPGQSEFSREMQRDLHTFKGGARMSGLLALGEAAHELETALVQIERLGGAIDNAAVERVGRQLDALHHQYDEIARSVAVSPAVPEPVPAEPEEAPAAEPQGPSWNPELFWTPGHEAAQAEARREAVRVPVERLDSMLSQAGEISIFHSRLEENHAALSGSLSEMAQTITRVREQLRLMDIETEAQIAARGFARNGDNNGEEEGHRYDAQFDPLEMDRYSRMQELSRSLAESVSDLSSLHASLDTSGSESEGLLQQQGRINNEVQQGLMGTLMVPFSRQVQRLARVVRQTAEQNGKRARAEFSGAESEMDRNVLERMTAPLEHLLRNSVVHGIEIPEARRIAGKPAEGVVHVGLKREGSQLLIEVRDDGRGLDFAAIRNQAIKRGLMRADAQVTDADLARFVFAPGFSTAQALTQDAGRGIGMDVVAAEVKQLGGTVELASETGRGARFRIRLPLMLAVSQALVVQVGEELFAIPLSAVEGIARAPRESLPEMMREGGPPLEYGGQRYQVRRLGELVGLPAPARVESRTVPAILMRITDGLGGRERRVAVVAERLIGNREIVTKPAGPILGSVAGISGATILADGRVMLIVDVPALIQEATRRRLGDEAAAPPLVVEETRRLIMVVDDSITIRRVTERLLVRKGYRVITAKDGLDAMAMLQTEIPDTVLLDIEMPRADGFEVAAFIRNTPRIANLPIIMITSRSGDKHRDRAKQLGVNRYLIKPYQEDVLLAELSALVESAESQIA